MAYYRALTAEQAKEIRRLYDLRKQYLAQAKKLTNAELAKKFKCGYNTISRICNGEIVYRLTGDDLVAANSFIAARTFIRQRAAEFTGKRLSQRFNCSRSVVQNILSGRYYADTE